MAPNTNDGTPQVGQALATIMQKIDDIAEQQTHLTKIIIGDGVHPNPLMSRMTMAEQDISGLKGRMDAMSSHNTQSNMQEKSSRTSIIVALIALAGMLISSATQCAIAFDKKIAEPAMRAVPVPMLAPTSKPM